jgi:hypothetical protein
MAARAPARLRLGSGHSQKFKFPVVIFSVVFIAATRFEGGVAAHYKIGGRLRKRESPFSWGGGTS